MMLVTIIAYQTEPSLYTRFIFSVQMIDDIFLLLLIGIMESKVF